MAVSGGSPEFGAVDYKPGGSGNAYQEFDLYLPDDNIYTKPAAGWPVAVFVNCSDFDTSANLGGTLSGDQLFMVEHGLAVCDATVSIKDAGLTGGGLFAAPEDARWATDDVAEKDLVWIVQKLRDASSTYGIDPNKIGLYGEEWASATLCQWVGMQADLADAGAGTTQEQQSSVPNAVCGIQGSWWNPALQDSLAQNHLRDSSTPTTAAATYGDALSTARLKFSPLYRALVDPSGGAAVPFLIRVQSATQLGQYGVDSNLFPTRTNSQAAEADGWQGLLGIDWIRNHHPSGRIYHQRKSTVATSAIAQYSRSDRYYADNDSLGQSTMFLLAALGGWQGTVETWDVPMKWAKSLRTTRRGLAANGVHSQRRQTMTSHSRGRLTESIRTWEIGHDQLFASDVTRLRAIATAGRHGALPVLFDVPDSFGVVPAHVMSYQYAQRGHDRYSYSALIEEAL